MFSSMESVNVTDWLAYPSYTIKDDFSSFELSPGLYYTNRIEWAASAMEMSVMGAKNVANLAAKYWKGEGVGQNTVVDDGDKRMKLQ